MLTSGLNALSLKYHVRPTRPFKGGLSAFPETVTVQIFCPLTDYSHGFKHLLDKPRRMLLIHPFHLKIISYSRMFILFYFDRDFTMGVNVLGFVSLV